MACTFGCPSSGLWSTHLLLKASPAQDGLSLSRAKGHGCFRSAFGADRARLRAGARVARHAFCFTGLAVFGVVGELFFVEKKLLSGGKDKFIPASDALERPIPEFHLKLSDS